MGAPDPSVHRQICGMVRSESATALRRTGSSGDADTLTRETGPAALRLPRAARAKPAPLRAGGNTCNSKFKIVIARNSLLAKSFDNCATFRLSGDSAAHSWAGPELFLGTRSWRQEGKRQESQTALEPRAAGRGQGVFALGGARRGRSSTSGAGPSETAGAAGWAAAGAGFPPGGTGARPTPRYSGGCPGVGT